MSPKRKEKGREWVYALHTNNCKVAECNWEVGVRKNVGEVD